MAEETGFQRWITRPGGGGFVTDQSSEETVSNLNRYYNSQELADSLIDYALDNKKSLVRIGQDVSACEWRERAEGRKEDFGKRNTGDAEDFFFGAYDGSVKGAWFVYNQKTGSITKRSVA